MSSAGFEGGEVGSEGAVDLSCDEALEAADGFFFGFAFGDAAVEVAAGRGRGPAGIGVWTRRTLEGLDES